MKPRTRRAVPLLGGMAMDPLTAFMNGYVATLTFLTELLKGMNPEQKEKMIDRWQAKLDKLDAHMDKFVNRIGN